MTRGLEEGRHVNLTDNGSPEDIYQLVASRPASAAWKLAPRPNAFQ
jgi:hypothetical protein